MNNGVINCIFILGYLLCMSAFSVFGNPIKHSKSPQIYSIFAKEFGISQIYTRVLSFWLNFDQVLKDFFYCGGLGANITMPFKERAFFLCDRVTSRASIACSVNTIKKEVDGMLIGDNTDGIGLLGDLNRLQWLGNDDDKKKKIRILLIGAGGASRGVVFPLLHSGCEVEIMNRTVSRAEEIVDSYKHLGKISLAIVENKIRSDISKKYDVIINATTGSWVDDEDPILPGDFITPSVACYDMSYQTRNNLTPFISWCQKNGAKYCSDGLGMLVGQAAHSFLFWHGVLPSVDAALEQLR